MNIHVYIYTGLDERMNQVHIYIYIHVFVYIYTHTYIHIYMCTHTGLDGHIYQACIQIHIYVQPIAFGVSFKLNLQSQSPWSLFNGTWQKRPRELDYRLRFEIEEVTLQMQ